MLCNLSFLIFKMETIMDLFQRTIVKVKLINYVKCLEITYYFIWLFINAPIGKVHETYSIVL